MYLREWGIYPKGWPLIFTQPVSMSYMNYILGTESGGNILLFLHKPKCVNVSTMPADFSDTAFQIVSLFFFFIFCFFIKTDL